MDAIRGVRTATPVPGEAALTAEQLAEYEALKKSGKYGAAKQAVTCRFSIDLSLSHRLVACDRSLRIGGCTSKPWWRWRSGRCIVPRGESRSSRFPRRALRSMFTSWLVYQRPVRKCRVL
jgi:hypothetical protein